jgi:hypothetical protein
MQNKIDQPNSGHWENVLLNDLSFIKKHLRYPINRRTIFFVLGILGSGSVLVWLCSLFLSGILRHFAYSKIATNDLLALIAMALFVFTILSLIYRRIKNLRFISISNDYFIQDNIMLLQQFLEHQQLAFYHHPNAPEVFQIASRILEPQYELREIMVFIADDKRILVNNHFTSNLGDKSMKSMTSNEHRKMAKALKLWMDNHFVKQSAQFNLKVMGK